MKHSIIHKCATCGEFYGILRVSDEPSELREAYCQCQAEGWELCGRHDGNIRRRFKTTHIISESGDCRGFGVYAMMAPCREDTCITPSGEMLEEVRALDRVVYTRLRRAAFTRD